ncbi:MAG: hypothetical protein J5I50_01665 [Chitinophagaceae bacterium]|nr:hypothetical protein [Chitinophagaceae bacterium]
MKGKVNWLKRKLKSNRLYTYLRKSVRKPRQTIKGDLRGNNNVINNEGLLFNVKLDIIGDNNLLEIGKNSTISNVTIYIRGSNHTLKIAENCHYKGGSIWFEDNDCKIVIQSHTTVESAHLTVTEPESKILIGTDCMLSNEIVFRTGDSHSIIDLTTKKRINYAADIVIGNHVWIGARSTILKGVCLGDNSIIGLNSVVTKNVPANCLAAGIPAKVIKTNVDWMRDRIYE